MKNGKLIKDINLNKIRKALKAVGTATKPKLAEYTGLSVVTVNSLVNLLMEMGEILPDATLDSEGGRPAASFRYNSNYRLSLVIFMHEFNGQDTAFYCVVNLRGEIIERQEQPLTNITIDDFNPKIERFLCKYPQIKAICFGIPGEEINQKLVISDYEFLRGQSLSGHIFEKFHLPVVVENDINAAVLGYCHQNKIQGNQCIIGLYFPDKYPPGAGIYMNGNIYKGRDGLAGEIKYLPLGIDWDIFDYNQTVLEEYIIKTIQVIMCMYNPDKIVMYGKKNIQSIQTMLQERCSSFVEQIMRPEIVDSADLNSDFEAGIKQIALNMIDTEHN